MKYIKLFIIALLLIIPATSHALDKKLGATNCFKIGIFDEYGGGIPVAALDITPPFSNLTIKVDCGSPASVTTVEETTGDSIEDELGGFYYICTDDTITYAVEDECEGWVEGEGNAAGLIAKSPVKFKAVGTTLDTIDDFIDTEVADIQNRLPAALINGKIDAGIIVKAITVSSATTSTITSAGLSEASNKNYVGGIVNCPSATAADNRAIFLKIISFNPTTDTVTLNGLFATALSVNDVCNVYIDTVR